MYHICVEEYHSGEGKRQAQLERVHRRLGRLGPKLVKNVRIMRVYATEKRRHKPKICPLCKEAELQAHATD